MSFIGKFVFYIGPEYLRTGEIIDQPTPDMVLIQLDCANCHGPHHGASIFSVAEFLKRDSDDIPEWTFFVTRAELDAYMASLDSEELDAAEPAAASLN